MLRELTGGQRVGAGRGKSSLLFTFCIETYYSDCSPIANVVSQMRYYVHQLIRCGPAVYGWKQAAAGRQRRGPTKLPLFCTHTKQSSAFRIALCILEVRHAF